MDRQLKQRVVGAALLVAFGVIVIPIFLDNGTLSTPLPETLEIPPAPVPDLAAHVEPLSQAAIDELESRADEDVELPLPRAERGGEGDEPVAGTLPPAVVDPPAPEALNAISPQPQPPAAVAPSPSSGAVESATTSNPAPAAKAATGSGAAAAWSVQLGSFSNDANARRLVEKLRVAGFAAQIERQAENGADVFKVRVGRATERAAAARLRTQLEQEFGVKGLLVRAP